MFTMLADLGLNAIGAGLVLGLSGLGSAIGMGIGIAKSVDAIGRQPEAEGKIRSTLMIGLAFCETVAIYGLLIAILLVVM